MASQTTEGKYRGEGEERERRKAERREDRQVTRQALHSNLKLVDFYNLYVTVNSQNQ